MRRPYLPIAIGCSVIMAGALLAWAQDKNAQESERKVQENEVPPAALAALKKLAGDAKITEYAEEIEHGHKFYEGSWKGPDGNIDGLVTEAGDVVEIEATVPGDKVPTGVRAAAEKQAGKDAKMSWEKKTLYLYEVHYKKDGKGHEMIYTADGRVFHEESDGGDEDEDKK